MQVGVLFVFQNFMDQMSDAEAYRRDIRIADMVEPLGYDFLSAVEHHFFSYALQPDNLQFLSYMAAKTSRIGLLPGAVILPWNNPLRIVEKVILLDHLSNGRALLGIGRGLARREYVRFGVDMNEARDRFDEAAEIIVRGLETGIVEGKGPYYPYEPTEVRPRPMASFRDRFNCVAMSSDSVPVCAKLGGRLMSFAIKPWEEMAPHFQAYRDLFREYHRREPPTPMCVESMCCDESAERAEALAREHIANYYMTVMDHYDLAGDHFRRMKGYSDYANNAQLLRDCGLESGANMYVEANIWGTPNQILEKLEKRRAFLGDFDLMVSPTFGGLSERDARNNLDLFGKKVLPELHSWKRAA